ncbi:hypothetical protein QO001_001430 [Methylobacterium brachiatum]|uniref:Uncharacterized protein n=1 Tax=Methylobacterium brachiatum TaxID=269660 RepID=A0AAJ1TK30_9HYPH|nr:hypothetical protein [Methylobacterium brachiatum]MCB4802170.1 hypothetical protein [Methylobacterium brachiatum]MDQ0542512.1 hypothetical protein [Methylobacterium brachiatum]
MADGEGRPDPRLLALARALGRYQAHLDMARGIAWGTARTSDCGDSEKVFVTHPDVFEGQGIDLHRDRDSNEGAIKGGVKHRPSRWNR